MSSTIHLFKIKSDIFLCHSNEPFIFVVEFSYLFHESYDVIRWLLFYGYTESITFVVEYRRHWLPLVIRVFLCSIARETVATF